METVMAGTVCKIIINGGTRGLSEGMERALTNPMVRGPMIPEKEADVLLDRLVRLDLACVDGCGGADEGDGLLQVLAELVDRGIVTDEVWRLYRKP